MVEKIEFVRNFADHSTNKGFQFEFHCDRCGTGFRTRFKPSVTGALSDVMGAASSLIGGIFGKAADVSARVHSAAWEKARDNAFVEAIREIKPEFIQCPRCSTWVCRKSCWNLKKGLCKGCAPDLGVEMAAAQASRSVEEVWAHAQMAEEDKKLSEKDWREGIRATCPSCNAPLPGNVKFCPQCGEKIKETAICGKCRAKIAPGEKFCPQCGNKVSE
ncbi:MAG: zinc ribbon domain-containing protein [Candidatus Sumerlaeota bacterium]|nr:zinc ribbon domain-containing protein [Candidatus Sumerlaeota bacterium]